MLYCNLFSGEGAQLEREPQRDGSIPVKLPDADAELLAKLIATPEPSAALAKLFLAGVTAGERAVRGGSLRGPASAS